MMLFLLCTAGMNVMADEPQWAKDLKDKNVGLIDSITVCEANASAPDYTSCIVYYNQPLQHAVADSPRFHMRALVTIHNNVDYASAVNHVYCSGYNLTDIFVYRPDSMFAHTVNSMTEIAHRYDANFIQIEHRYFKYSAPDLCWQQLDYLTAEEAAQDFHALFDALKKVFKGKWVMSGTSKGGVTTLLQHTFFPNDMDVFVPYCAPFFESDRDRAMPKYWYNNGWSKEFRDIFMNVRQNALLRKETIFPIYEKMNGGDNTQEKRDVIYGYYLAAINLYGYTDHAYNDTTTLRKQLAVNQKILDEKGLEYGDTVYAYMLQSNVLTLDSLPKWIDLLRKYPDPKAVMPKRMLSQHNYRPFGIEMSQWYDEYDTTFEGKGYEYQSKCELGYFDASFDLLFDDPTVAEEWQTFWSNKYGCIRDVYTPFYSTLTHSRALYDRAMEATKNATAPILFIYGEDDAWTGAAVKDEFVNGTNVRKFILPGQNHGVSYTSNTDPDKCRQILQFLDATLGSAPTAICELEGKAAQEDDGYYNLWGQRVDKNARGVVIHKGRKYVNK